LVASGWYLILGQRGRTRKANKVSEIML